jgi:hypothetical protein
MSEFNINSKPLKIRWTFKQAKLLTGMWTDVTRFSSNEKLGLLPVAIHSELATAARDSSDYVGSAKTSLAVQPAGVEFSHKNTVSDGRNYFLPICRAKTNIEEERVCASAQFETEADRRKPVFAQYLHCRARKHCATG